MYKSIFSPFYYLMNLYVHGNKDIVFEPVKMGKDICNKTMLEIEPMIDQSIRKRHEYHRAGGGEAAANPTMYICCSI